MGGLILINQLSCTGCGAKIQTTDKNGIGYAPESSLNKEVVVCQRCFRLKHYNEVQDVSLTESDFLKIINDVSKKDALIVKLVDIFDFDGSWLQGIGRFAGNNRVLLIGNKMDLLPKVVNPNKLIHWMKFRAKELGLKPVDVLLVSGNKGLGLDDAIEKIEEYRKGKDVYVVGCTNVGKSTFINAIIKRITGEADIITTSHYPGTTLDVIEIPLDDDKSMYDTPGIINNHQMAHFVEKEDLKIITPKKEIKVRTFQLNEGQTLFFGGLARLDFKKGDRNSFGCYIANDLDIHRTKLDNANALYEKHVGELLSPPRKNQLGDFPKMISREISVKEGKTDIVFSGLGWVTVNSPGAIVMAHVPKGVNITVRKSLI